MATLNYRTPGSDPGRHAGAVIKAHTSVASYNPDTAIQILLSHALLVLPFCSG